MRSSKPGPGCDAAAGMSGIGGGGAGWLGGASASVVSILISSGSDGAIGASRTGIGGGMDVVAAVDASIASSRARSMAARLNALRAKMNATIAITSEKKSNGKSNIEPPGDWPGLRAYRVKSSASPAHPQARRGPLLQHLAAEAKQRGGPPTGLCRHHPGWFDQGAGFHEAPEILLVQVPPRDRFHGPLQFSKCKFGRQ